MDTNIKSLKPQQVWKHFDAICAIPHPSHHEKAIRNYVLGIAKASKLAHSVDEAGNVIISKPATAGMENCKGIILQAHLDMVPQKNGDKVFDFEKDPIEAYVDGDWVKAKGTTLGADNGLGLAAILAVLEANDLKHGAIEALLTASEETGMGGAIGLEKGVLKGDILLNLDTETEGELCVGCAGGIDLTAEFKYFEDMNNYSTREAVLIEITGLKGGHSGLEIGLQRANANKILFRFLRFAMMNFDLHIGSIDCGGLRNAIPREARAIVAGPGAYAEDFLYGLSQYEKIIQNEYAGIEDNISITGTCCAVPKSVWDRNAMERVINSVCGCPNGVIKTSASIPGLVETSTNLARVVSGDGKVEVQCLLRSSSASEKEGLASDMSGIFELANANVRLSGDYPGWNPDMESPILVTMKENYKKLFGREAKIKAVHAGLECGIIGGKYPKLDMISFGPTIKYPHSPTEKAEIASVGKFWDLLTYTLANAPVK